MLTCSRLLKLQSLIKEFLPASDKCRFQILCKMSEGSGKVPMLSKIFSIFPSLPFILLFPIREFCIQIKVAATLALAPLRRILYRSLKVHEYQRVGSRHPKSFVVIDTLECGHEFVDYAWSFRDLLYAYADPVDSPHVTARRHRCHECRDIAAAKKPVRSVQIAKAVAA